MSTTLLRRSAPLLCALLAGTSSLPAAAEEPPLLSFPEVATRVLATNPEAARAALVVAARRAGEAGAAQRPAFELGAEAENLLGTGDYNSLDSAELTLSLGTVLERGGKRDGRQAAAAAATAVATADADVARLDLLAEAARRYLAVAVADEQQRLAGARRDQAAEAAEAAGRRVAEASAPRPELLAAGIRLAEAELAVSLSARRSASTRAALAALWAGGGQAPDAPAEPFQVAVDFGELPPPRPLGDLEAELRSLPDLGRYAAEDRLRAADLALAKAAAVADWRWSLGFRHLAASDDEALVASFSVPLGQARRAAPAMDAAVLEARRTGLDRAARERALLDLLRAQWQLLTDARETALVIGTQLVPPARESRELLERGWRIGRYSWLELAAGTERLAELENRRLAAAADYHAARLEIERLSGAWLQLIEDRP